MENNVTIRVEKISDLLHTLYSSVTSGDWSQFLKQVLDITQSNKAFISLKNIRTDSPLFLNAAFNFDYPPEAVIAYQQRHLEDPLYHVVKYLPEGEIIEPSKILDINSYIDSDFYRHILGPLKSHHAMGLVVLRDDTYDASFVINRGPTDNAYTDNEYAFLAMLRPHVQHAMRLFTLFRDISLQHDMLKVVLDQNDKALMVLQTNASIMLSNKHADYLLATHSLWQRQGNSFLLANRIYQKRMLALLEQCTNNTVQQQDKLYLQISAENSQFCLAFAPLRWLSLPQNSDNLCLVTISYQQRVSWEGIKKEFELTNRELQLVQALFQNQKLKNLANTYQISYHTLRRHLQAVFTKCQVNSQSELILLISRFRY